MERIMTTEIGVVGGGGYVGGAIAQELSRDFGVRIVDVKEPLWNYKDYNVEFVKCDIRVFDRVFECLKDVDFVVHTAIVQIPRINDERRLGLRGERVWGLQNVCEAVYSSPSG